METVGTGEKRKAWDASSTFDEPDYASNWKRGVYSFPSGTTRSMGTPFTHAAQWLEFQRQALIYKHITASIPVPPYLLTPLHYSNASYYMRGGTGSSVNLGFLANKNDLEPKRCRRTDGKKWRCSKDAAPDQKYCERHMNRGKPRSRKPVEAPKCKAPASTTITAAWPTNSIPVGSPVVRGVDNSSWNYVGFSDPYGNFGNQEDKPSGQLKHAGSKPRVTETIQDDDACKQPYHNSLNLNCTNMDYNMNDYSVSLLNSGLCSIKHMSMHDQNIETRGFIDAWSTEKATPLASSNNLTSPDLPHSGLCLSVPNDQIDLGIVDSLPSMQSTVTWTNHDTSHGGPLGELFQPHQQQHIDITEEPHAAEMFIDLWNKGYNKSNEKSPEESPTSRPIVSSPTGILQKRLVSHSDKINVSSPGCCWDVPSEYFS